MLSMWGAHAHLAHVPLPQRHAAQRLQAGEVLVRKRAAAARCPVRRLQLREAAPEVVQAVAHRVLIVQAARMHTGGGACLGNLWLHACTWVGLPVSGKFRLHACPRMLPL